MRITETPATTPSSGLKPARPAPAAEPSAPRPDVSERYRPPPAVGGSVRPIGGSVRDASGKPTPPTARDLYERRSSSATGGATTRGKSPSFDGRYAPTRPVAPADVVRSPKPSPTAQPRSVPRPSPIAGDRFAKGLGATAPQPRATAVTPTLRSAPDAGAPRLQPRSIASGLTGRQTTGGSFLRPRASIPASYWWDPCHSGHGWSGHSHSHWHSGHAFTLHGGHGCFGFGLSFWYPWYHYQRHCWNVGYSTCWWDRWTDPWCARSSYWWYPETTYCPTYLYVPSSVVVVSTEPATPAGAPLVAGGAVAGSAAIGGSSPAPADPDVPALDLARRYVELGDFYFKAARFEEAEEAYARARTYAPLDATVHFVLADAAFATGDWHFAAFLIGEALRLDPALASAETDKRRFYGEPRLFDEHMAALDAYVAEKPYDASAHLVRGYNLRFSGRPAAAIAAFRRVLEIAPEHTAATTFLLALAPADADAPAIR